MANSEIKAALRTFYREKSYTIVYHRMAEGRFTIQNADLADYNAGLGRRQRSFKEAVGF